MKESPSQVLYEDDRIACTDSAVIIRGVEQIELGSGRWRIWGGTDPRYWFHLDLKRPHKRWALVLELGKRIRPVITPDDPARVKVIIEQHLGG